MEALKTVLNTILQKQNLDNRLKDFRVFDIWEEAVGTRIARHSQPRGLKDHILRVAVDNSIWVQQLTFLEEQLKEKLNRMMGSAVVEKIRFQIGEINAPSLQTREEADEPLWQSLELDDAVKEDIEKEVAAVKDEELKNRLKNLFKKNVQFLTYKSRE